jgi:uncharacterized protein
VTDAPTFRSALYEGVIIHHRTEPEHRFTQKVVLPLLFVDELDEASRLHPLVHLDPARPPRRRHGVRLVRSDFVSPHDVPIGQAVAGLVEAAGGEVRGPVAVLGHVRTWGWLFNPLTLYYCFDPAGRSVEWTVLEVTNTPWHERHCYVIGPPGRHTVRKSMHVSPFLPMEAVYDIRYSPPGARLSMHFDVRASATRHRLLTASMQLHRRPLDRPGLDRLLWRRPAMTARVSAGIYARAAQLAARGVVFHPHPGQRVPARTERVGAGAERVPADKVRAATERVPTAQGGAHG